MNGDVYGRPSYATLDPRKQSMSHQYEGMPQYDEIPYGDGPGPRGPIPEVPADYAQVPAVPLRQGAFLSRVFSFFFFRITCAVNILINLYAIDCKQEKDVS